MPTLNQRRTAQKVKEVIEKKIAVDGKDVLAFIGYSKGIQKNPQMVFNSKGFKEAMKELGFSLEAADLMVAKILQTGREENRLRASDQIYKRLGGYAPEKQVIGYVSISKLLDDIENGES
jgi:hypothetical protein